MHPHGTTLQNSSRSSRHPWMAHRKILRLAAQTARIRPESQDVKEDVRRALTANEVMKVKQGSHLPIVWLLIDLIREDKTSECHNSRASLWVKAHFFYRASFAWDFLGVHPINRPEDRVLKIWWSKKEVWKTLCCMYCWYSKCEIRHFHPNKTPTVLHPEKQALLSSQKLRDTAVFPQWLAFGNWKKALSGTNPASTWWCSHLCTVIVRDVSRCSSESSFEKQAIPTFIEKDTLLCDIRKM